jgi:hypothetical protein
MNSTDAIAEIEAAFAVAPRPTNDAMHHPDSADNTDLQPLFVISHWRDMTDQDVIANYAAPSFMSAEGFRHFLPAYMSFALRNPNSAEACVSGIIWHLDPSLYDERLAAYTRSKFALLTSEQRSAIRTFLEAMTDSIYADDAQRALAEWLDARG